jgi:outer membrane biosynthesis protein TonB
MDAHRFFPSTRNAVFALLLAMLLAGCKSTPPATDDASLNAKVASTLAADQNLNGQTIQASASAGIVTLNGSVTSDTARSIATGDVAQIAGVRTVVDNLVVQAPAPVAVATAPTVAPPPPPPVAAKSKKPAPAIAPPPPPPPAPAPVVRNTPLLPAPQPAPVVVKTQPPPPPVPVEHNITLSVGTAIPVRITQTLDSATTQTGDKFTGEIATDLIVDGMVVLPQGTPVTGHVDAVQDAAHYKGSSLLTISLSAIDRKGTHIEVSTESYTKQGEGRGKNTAEKVGAGAAVGAILGGILGGGRGAAIGTAAGAGVGAGSNTVTRGQQVQIASETVVRFRLLDPIVVRVTAGAAAPGGSSSSLERRTDQ